MNSLTKVLVAVPVCVSVCNGAEVIFNGCNHTPNDYFDFTSGGGG